MSRSSRSNSVVGICRLCQRERPLKDSHVIPMSFFTILKRRGGPATQGSDNLLYRVRPTQDSWSQPMLCADCEQKISRWERYAIEVIRKPGRHKVIVRKTPETWGFFNVDYARFRLFQLSLLFRACVSTRAEFEHYSAPAPRLERMRYLLNAQEAPDGNEFPCLMEVLLNPLPDSVLCTRLVGAPAPLFYEGRKHQWFVFGGYCWYFVEPELSPVQLTYESHLQRGGFMKLPALNPHEHPWIARTLLVQELKVATEWSV